MSEPGSNGNRAMQVEGGPRIHRFVWWSPGGSWGAVLRMIEASTPVDALRLCRQALVHYGYEPDEFSEEDVEARPAVEELGNGETGPMGFVRHSFADAWTWLDETVLRADTAEQLRLVAADLWAMFGPEEGDSPEVREMAIKHAEETWAKLNVGPLLHFTEQELRDLAAV